MIQPNKIQTLDQIKDKYYGLVGTSERERLENGIKKALLIHKHECFSEIPKIKN